MRLDPRWKLLAVTVVALTVQACAGNPSAPERSEHRPVAVADGGERDVVTPVPSPQVVAEPQVSDAPAPARRAIPQINDPGSLPPLPRVQTHPPAVSVAGEDIVQLDYEQVELRQVLEEIGDALGLSMVIDSSIGDKVTLRTAENRPLKHADLWPLLQLLVGEAGISLEKRGNVYHAKKDPTPLPREIGRAGELNQLVGGEVMQISPIRYLPVESALNLLRPLVEPKGRILSVGSLNLLAVITSPERLTRINQLINLFDSDPFVHRGLRLYPVKNAKAVDVAKDLEAVIKAVEGQVSSYQLVALERINAILVVAAPNRGFGEIERWLDILDSGDGEGGERVFIYRVKNLDAKALASTLSSVFKSENKQVVKEEPKEELVKRTEKVEKDGKKAEEKPANLAEAATAAAEQAEPVRAGGPATADIQVSIVADEDTNSLLVRALPRDYKQLLETIAELDRVPQEVMINVVIAEVTLGESNRFGVEWNALNSSGRSSLSAQFGIAGELASDSGLSGLVLNQVSNRLTTLLNILDRDSNLRVLSRPSILVRDNQEAVIKVGSEEPVLTRVTTSNTTVGGTSQYNNDIQYRDTGIILTVTPHINEDGIINLEIQQEISQVGGTSATLDLPRFTNREVKTSAVVRDGSALILGGIIQDTMDSSNTGIPGLKELPGIGGFFSDDSVTVDRTELVLIMVPELINPHDDNTEVMRRVYGNLREVSKLIDQYGITGFDWN